MGKLSPLIPDAGHGVCIDCKLYGEVLRADISLESAIDSNPRIHNFRYGGVLHRASEQVDAVFHIQSGIVKMVRFGADGGQRIVRVLKAGDIAEVESIVSDTFEHTAIAIDNVSACRIPIELFRKHVASSEQIQAQVLRQSLIDLREAETWLLQFTGNATSARARVARLLLCLRVDAGDSIRRIGLEDMAIILGVTIETVSRIISEFRRQGIIANGTLRAGARNYFRAEVAALERIARETPKAR